MNTRVRKPMTLRKRVIITIIGMVALFFILKDVMQVTSDIQQMNSQAQASAWKSDFIHAYEARDGEAGDLDPALAYELVSNAEVLCTYLDEDPDLAYAWTYGTDKLGMSSDQTVVVIEEAIHFKCPQFSSLLQAGE
jgi:hypothetical protein